MPLFAFAPVLVSTLTLFVLFSYLYLVHGERYLGLWTTAWGFWFVRHVYAAFVGRMEYGEVAVIPILLAMSYVTFVLLL